MTKLEFYCLVFSFNLLHELATATRLESWKRIDPRFWPQCLLSGCGGWANFYNRLSFLPIIDFKLLHSFFAADKDGFGHDKCFFELLLKWKMFQMKILPDLINDRTWKMWAVRERVDQNESFKNEIQSLWTDQSHYFWVHFHLIRFENVFQP